MDETITATGHEHVTATHRSTFEITTDDYLTPAGDCIIGIAADRSPADLPLAFTRACQDHDAVITATITTPHRAHTITGTGHPDLSFASDRSLVGRTSDYIDDRTVMINASGAAAAINRDLITHLATGGALELTLTVTPPATN